MLVSSPLIHARPTVRPRFGAGFNEASQSVGKLIESATQMQMFCLLLGFKQDKIANDNTATGHVIFKLTDSLERHGMLETQHQVAKLVDSLLTQLKPADLEKVAQDLQTPLDDKVQLANTLKTYANRSGFNANWLPHGDIHDPLSRLAQILIDARANNKLDQCKQSMAAFGVTPESLDVLKKLPLRF